jgi:hypothetical protein
VAGAFWLGPVIALLAVGLLMLLLRWTYGGTRMPGPAHRATGTGADDFGLLRRVALVRTVADANALRAVLSDADIRTTMVAAEDERYQVMVFAVDLERARRLIGPV